MKIVIDGKVSGDPDFLLGSCVTLYREDGRSLWKQRLLVKKIMSDRYVLSPVDVMVLGVKHGG